MKSKPVSGKSVVTVLVRHFGFEKIRQRGSHVVLRKFIGKRKVVTVVPVHAELRRGTLRSVLRLAGLTLEEFERRR